MPYQGKIDSTGYTPPPAVVVHWSNGAQKPLDTSKDFIGWHDDDIPRYGSGDQSLASHHPSAVGVENRGGEADRILKKLFEIHGGPDRNPTPREVSDFAIVHGGKRILGVGDWLALAGVESPVPQAKEGTVENPIVVRDSAFANGHRKRIDIGDGRGELVYQNDLSSESIGKGPFPLPALTTPPKPPTVPTNPIVPTDPTPNPPTKPGTTVRTIAIEYRFDKALEFPLPIGASRVHFDGQLLIAAAVKPKTRSPVLKVGVGPKPPKGSGRRRFNVGSPVVNASGGRALEWADKTQPVGGGRLPIGQLMPFVFTWTAGTGSVVVWNGRRKETDPLPNLADQGGNVVFGVDPVDDPEADYVPLPAGSRLVGTLTIEAAAGTQPQPGTGSGQGPVEPPIDQPGTLLAMATEAFAKVEDGRNAVAALLAAIEAGKR